MSGSQLHLRRYGNFPLMIALIGVVTFLLLARAFRSLLLPLKAARRLT